VVGAPRYVFPAAVSAVNRDGRDASDGISGSNGDVNYVGCVTPTAIGDNGGGIVRRWRPGPRWPSTLDLVRRVIAEPGILPVT